jgi:hypothetical protein
MLTATRWPTARFASPFPATVPGIKRRQCAGSPAAMLPAAVEVGRLSYTMLPSLQLRNRESRFKEDWPFSLVIEAIRFSRTLVGRRNNFQWTGKDFLAGHNVSAIVLKVPNSALGSRPPVGIWARVRVPHCQGQFLQAERVGRPFANVVFNSGDKEAQNMFNQSQPAIHQPMKNRASLSTV